MKKAKVSLWRVNKRRESDDGIRGLCVVDGSADDLLAPPFDRSYRCFIYFYVYDVSLRGFLCFLLSLFYLSMTECRKTEVRVQTEPAIELMFVRRVETKSSRSTRRYLI